MELIEILWDIFTDIVNEFFFELNSGFFTLMFHGIPRRTRSRKYGRHRSLVRLIGTALPLKPCQRTYSQIFSSEKYGPNLRFGSDLIDYPVVESNDFEEWSRDLKSNAPDVVSCITFSTPKEQTEGRSKTSEISAEKFAALEEQVLQLQADIAKILSAQLLQPNQVSESTTPEEDKDGCLRTDTLPEKMEGDVVSSSTDVAEKPPVPLPPPPPPLPPVCLTPRPLTESQSLTDQINSYSINQLNNAPHTRPSNSAMPSGMAEVLKNIGNVKLRRVERSPGGTPLRRRPLSPPRNDPAALLAAALRRRFAHMRPDESSPEKPHQSNLNQRMLDELSSKSIEDMEQMSFGVSPQH